MNTDLVKSILATAASIVAALGNRASLRQRVEDLEEAVKAQQQLLNELSNQIIYNELEKLK